MKTITETEIPIFHGTILVVEMPHQLSPNVYTIDYDQWIECTIEEESDRGFGTDHLYTDIVNKYDENGDWMDSDMSNAEINYEAVELAAGDDLSALCIYKHENLFDAFKEAYDDFKGDGHQYGKVYEDLQNLAEIHLEEEEYNKLLKQKI